MFHSRFARFMMILAAGAMPLATVSTCNYGPGGGTFYLDQFEFDDDDSFDFGFDFFDYDDCCYYDEYYTYEEVVVYEDPYYYEEVYYY